DVVKTANGETVQQRTAYTEIGTQLQVPTEPCNVHGEPRARLARFFSSRFFSSGKLPRGALGVGLSEVTPIAVKSPTLLAHTDPYNSLKPTLKPESAAQPAVQTAANKKTDSAAGQSASNPA